VKKYKKLNLLKSIKLWTKSVYICCFKNYMKEVLQQKW